jgi:hypothetical protein
LKIEWKPQSIILVFSALVANKRGEMDAKKSSSKICMYLYMFEGLMTSFIKCTKLSPLYSSGSWPRTPSGCDFHRKRLCSSSVLKTFNRM